MKIALIGLAYPFRGGIAHYTTILCDELRRSYEVRFFSLNKQYPSFLFPGTTQYDESDSVISTEHEVTLEALNPISWLKTFHKIRKCQPDLILFSWWHPFFALAFGSVAHLANLIAKIPSCYLCHNVMPHESSMVDKLLLRYAYSGGKAFITHSQEDQGKLKSLVANPKVITQPHPTYATFASQTQQSEFEAKATLHMENKKVLLFFGYIRQYKGLKFLLEAMINLEVEDDYHLLIVGEFYGDRGLYSEQLALLNERQQLTLIDRYVPNEEIPLYFQACDIVVLPYVSATQSGIIQIAYGFEKLVIATNVGGIPEVIVDRKTGYIVKSASASAIETAVREFFSIDRKQQFRKEINGYRRKFSWHHMVDAIESIQESFDASKPIDEYLNS